MVHIWCNCSGEGLRSTLLIVVGVTSLSAQSEQIEQDDAMHKK
jgi:hypothetical protein